MAPFPPQQIGGSCGFSQPDTHPAAWRHMTGSCVCPARACEFWQDMGLLPSPYRGQRLTSGVFLSYSPLYSMRQGLSGELRAPPCDQSIQPACSSSLPPKARILYWLPLASDIYENAGDPKSSLHTWAAPLLASIHLFSLEAHFQLTNVLPVVL